MLISRAECGERSLSDRASVRKMLSKALRPELNEPRREVAQWIGVRHEDVYRLGVFCVGEPLKHSVHARWIVSQLVRFASSDHVACSAEQPTDIDAD